MSKWLRIVSMWLGCAAIAQAGPAPLTTLAEIHKLTNLEASRHLPVEFDATVTYYRGYERTLFVQDGDVAIYVAAPTGLNLIAGDRIRVRGTTHESFRPFVSAASITKLGHGRLPPPVRAGFDDLIHARYDCRLVTVHALVRTADRLSIAARNGAMQLVAAGGNIDVTVDTDDAAGLRSLLDAEVDVTGAASGRFDGKMQQTGILLHVPSLQDVKVVRRASVDPWSVPVMPMNEILTSYHVENSTPRARVRGSVTYYHPGTAVVLQSGDRSLWIATQSRDPLTVGNIADAIGIPDVHDGFLTLTRGEIRDSGIAAPVLPVETTWNELSLSHHIFDLVSVEGRLVTEVREAARDEYVLLADGQLFSAILQHPSATSEATRQPTVPALKQIAPGSRVRVTGICIQSDSNPFDANVPFDIMMRSSSDIGVVASPSWVSVRNLTMLAGLLVLTVILVGARGWSLEHRIRRETAFTASVERMRSSVLEDINRARPIGEIITKITGLLAFKLNGATCWCQLEGGNTLGQPPAVTGSLEIIEHPIPSHAGKPLGTLYAAFDPDSKIRKTGPETLFNAAQLAALAIETGGLYSDLVYRSQFDQLTDLHNRFALGKCLESLTEGERAHDRVFGLIYVDLDDFKKVNDRYGHRIGDLYLQEVAHRMKRLLRPHDMLARLGGDEFAIVVPSIHTRAEVEEIVHRLERCFDEPLRLDGHELRGTASIGIALFPEDGATQDALLSAADAAMYRVKNARRAPLHLPAALIRS